MKKNAWFIGALLGIFILNVWVHYCFFRIDLTADKRYSVNPATKTLLKRTDAVEVTLFLDGALNAGFLRLQQAAIELLGEFNVYGDVTCRVVNPALLSQNQQEQLNNALAEYNFRPTAIYERDKDGKAVQTVVWPYAKVAVGNRETMVSLLQNNRGLSGAENLNHSIETLEYNFAEAIHSLTQEQRAKVAFLEGHGELPEHNTADVQMALEKWFDVYRGSITADADCLQPFKALVIADPQASFSEQDKYIIDRYVMQGGRVLWLLNGVQFSQDVLSGNGFTPVIPLDLNLQDLLFRYGVRVNPRLVADLQCLSIPVDVSPDPAQPQYQPMPWCYAPLLLTSDATPLTKNLMQLSASFVSDIEFVGESDGQLREVLLATGNASRLIPTPSEINLSDVTPDPQLFQYAYVPVGVSIEGTFSSLFAHRISPEGVVNATEKKTFSVPTRQIFVASGSIVRNEWQNGQSLPVGYDRYSGIRFGNRDFLVNALLWLADDSGLIELRQKTIPLRMLNRSQVDAQRTACVLWSLLVPLGLLMLLAVVVLAVRRWRYGNRIAQR
ncbi:MAG: gliding motility-associated ABC transporter substrate-binding protein GldG [Paludibacter sp.]|nr:gliding motility-associated ABC transporter substrate-binding protein GldG [Bacteroidales bacterium]MCM1069174.1 gliding motility-associated ABC transporter substrate-binding protein GldG [Prevotella sp.]MCM1354079.1 gliding motility-associated ABC transporter substrate-binding protein GldG [Bacteroides sp.]MCM1442948.1 gliding motility-associated ABC transporter substrate-binding protein GldG [Muribaculum sp.]MCM1481729.1 gliding motility-associated ABC transporter substrate-binding protein